MLTLNLVGEKKKKEMPKYPKSNSALNMDKTDGNFLPCSFEVRANHRRKIIHFLPNQKKI